MGAVNLKSILSFFDDFTGPDLNNINTGAVNARHRVGTIESANFARNISKMLQNFGLSQVHF